MADLSVLCVNVKYLFFFLLQLGGFSVFYASLPSTATSEGSKKFLPAQPIVTHIWVEFHYVWHQRKLGLEDEPRPSPNKMLQSFGDKKMREERFGCGYTSTVGFYCDATINQISGFPTLGASLAGIFRSAVRTPTQLTTNSLTFGSRWLFLFSKQQTLPLRCGCPLGSSFTARTDGNFTMKNVKNLNNKTEAARERAAEFLK